METMDITLAERGQIVIPKEARDELGLKPVLCPVRFIGNDYDITPL